MEQVDKDIKLCYFTCLAHGTYLTINTKTIL